MLRRLGVGLMSLLLLAQAASALAACGDGADLAMETSATVQPSEIPGRGPRPIIPVDVSLTADSANSLEGQGVSLTVTLTNITDQTITLADPFFLSFSETLGFRVRNVTEPGEEAWETLPETASEPYYGHTLTLEAGTQRSFNVTLSGFDLGPPGISWLQPGTYSVAAMYRPRLPDGMVADSRLDYDSVTISDEVTIEILQPPAVDQAAAAELRELVLHPPDPLEGIDRADRFFEHWPDSYLKTRVLWYQAWQMLRLGMDDQALERLRQLSIEELTPGEKAVVFTQLGDLFFHKEEFQLAEEALLKAGTVRSEFLLEALPRN